MKIKQVEFYHLDLRARAPRHQMIVVHLRTDAGLCGAGEIAMVYGDGAEGALATARALAEKYVIGSDPERPELLWHTLMRKTHWGLGRNVALYGAMSAFDIACWDIKGQAVGRPVHSLLGGKVRDKIKLYANHWYGDATSPAQFATRAAETVADGYLGLKFDPLRAQPKVNNGPSQYLDRATARLGIERVRAVRAAIGPDCDLIIDLHGDPSATDAIRWCREIEEFDPLFIEEPTDTLAVKPMQKIAAALRCPLAGGERLYTRQDFQPFLEAQVFDVIQPDICLAGGFTELRKIAAVADSYQVAVHPHNCAGPVCTAATVQFVAATTNFFIQEWFPYWEDDRYAMVTAALEPQARSGYLTISDDPGLGVTLNEDYLHPYRVATVD